MKKFSISIFMFCLLLMIGYYYSYDYTIKNKEDNLISENTKDQTVDSMQIVDAASDPVEKGYYIGLKDGQVVVFEADRTTIYEYTDIIFDGLPVEIQEQILEGKYMRDQKSLYSFLENYSS